jgi:hypothetical protein
VECPARRQTQRVQNQGQQVLARVVEKLGSAEHAAARLGVSATLLQRFLSGTIPLPDQLLLKAMDLVVDGVPSETPALAQPQTPKGPIAI